MQSMSMAKRRGVEDTVDIVQLYLNLLDVQGGLVYFGFACNDIGSACVIYPEW